MHCRFFLLFCMLNLMHIYLLAIKKFYLKYSIFTYRNMYTIYYKIINLRKNSLLFFHNRVLLGQLFF